jgi:hypothetical protein
MMKEVQKVYLKGMKTCFGESLKTNLLHYTYNKSKGFLHLYNGQKQSLLVRTCDGLDKIK